MEFIYRPGMKNYKLKTKLWTKSVLTVTVAISLKCLSEDTCTCVGVSMFGWPVICFRGDGGVISVNFHSMYSKMK